MTVAIYQVKDGEKLRVGTFTVRKYSGSVQAIGEQFIKQYPNFPPDELYIANRIKLFGKWCDQELLKAFPSE